MYQQNYGHENEYDNVREYDNYGQRPTKDSFEYLAAADVETTYQINKEKVSETR